MLTFGLLRSSSALALAALLACGAPEPGTTDTTTTTTTTDSSTASSTDAPSSTGAETSTTTSATTTTDAETFGETTTTGPVTGGDTTLDTTTTTGVPACGEGWCASKEFVNIIIMDNHEMAHELVIPAADVAACVERTYDIQGAADHNHTVTLTPADFASIDQGGQLDLESTVDQGHSHKIWGDCE